MSLSLMASVTKDLIVNFNSQVLVLLFQQISKHLVLLGTLRLLLPRRIGHLLMMTSGLIQFSVIERSPILGLGFQQFQVSCHPLPPYEQSLVVIEEHSYLFRP